MATHIPESDWKKFRKLREIALERFCERTLKEIEKLAAGSTDSPHQTYLEVYELIQKRDSELGQAFNDPRRSRAVQQLGAINARGLLEIGELDTFTDSTREAVELYSAL